MEEREEDGASLREKLEIFLAARLEKRLETQKEESKRAALIERFIYDNWFEYAASKVEKLQAATHIAKFSHPSIKKASDIYFDISDIEREGLIGSHSVAWQSFQHDLSAGNAADLDGDIKEFLRVSHGGRTVFDMILEQDEELKAAVNPESDQAEYILQALLSLKDTRNEKRSHALSKQVFWLVHEDPSLDRNYYLLSPMLATSLAHVVFKTISESRFGASSKEGRNARRTGKGFDGEYQDYPNLAVQKMGGSNQQNVSQLNSERGGQNYLLASLPPHWQSREVYPPMSDAFRAFKRRPEVWKTLGELKRFLETDPDPTMHTRDLRDDFAAMLVDELMLFTFDMHSLAPGWSADENCRLVAEEQHWLDPGRAHGDADFDQARRQSNWHEFVSDRAATWLNRELGHNNRLNMGDPEHGYWQKQVGVVIDQFSRQLDDLQDALRDDDERLEGDPT